jgi:hypothetical protein
MECASKYRVAKHKSVRSGQHNNDFWLYCNGSVDAFYMHKWLMMRESSDLDEIVAPDLPAGAFNASSTAGSSDDKDE